MKDDDRLIKIGIIGKPFGLRGLFFLNSLLYQPDDLIELNDKIVDHKGEPVQIFLEKVKSDKLIAGIKGISSCSQANLLKNKELFIKRSDFPKLSDGEFYHVDLIGLKVFKIDNDFLGTVTDVVNFGAGDILEIEIINSKKIVYHPFQGDFIYSVDLANSIIIIDRFE